MSRAAWRVAVDVAMPSGVTAAWECRVTGVGPGRALTMAEELALEQLPGGALAGAWCYWAESQP